MAYRRLEITIDKYMNDQLQRTLTIYTHTSWESNPAMRQILDGYALFHASLAVVGTLFLVAFVVLSTKSWASFRHVAKIRRFRWPFEKKVYFFFASLFMLVSLFLSLITIANISNATKPLPGFTDSISSLQTNAYNRDLHQAFSEWILSEKVAPPALVQQSIQHRQIFHGVRLLISGSLLIMLSISSWRLWRSLIARRRVNENGWTVKEASWLALAILTVPIALYLLLAFMANLQSVIAPIANTLQFGR